MASALASFLDLHAFAGIRLFTTSTCYSPLISSTGRYSLQRSPHAQLCARCPGQTVCPKQLEFHMFKTKSPATYSSSIS